ncbi:hypothetical protein BWQ93_08180 [Sphingopyxis sp. QXT-31]|nr:hypothetical protein BWQ93_08180 [Sphingopyxis sp. QXT-31]
MVLALSDRQQSAKFVEIDAALHVPIIDKEEHRTAYATGAPATCQATIFIIPTRAPARRRSSRL